VFAGVVERLVILMWNWQQSQLSTCRSICIIFCCLYSRAMFVGLFVTILFVVALLNTLIYYIIMKETDCVIEFIGSHPQATSAAVAHCCLWRVFLPQLAT